MRLSTSSFKHFIGKSLFVGLGLSIVYALLVQRVQPTITFSQNQYQANAIFAQNFIYRDEKPSKIIVGSSMATRMKFKKEDAVYNLAFGGGGPLTGLEIIKRSGYVPDVIFIESNVFAMEADNEFLDVLFRPVLFQLRGKVIAFQEKYQVLNFVGEALYRVAGRSKAEKLAQKVDKSLLDKLVNTTLANEKPFTVNDAVLKDWHKNISYFHKKGTKLIFFEMPNDSRLVQTKSREALRAMIRDEFPKLTYLEENNAEDRYKTGDGIHLTLKSAMDFSEWFEKEVLLIHGTN